MRARLPQWIALLTVFFLAQLGWWGYSLWTRADDLYRAGYRSLHERLDLAQAELSDELAGGADPAQVWPVLSTRFPGIVRLPAADGVALQISGQAAESLAQRRSRLHAMVLGEGAFFLALTGAAVWLMRRGLRREADLALQESNFLAAVTHEFRSPLQSLRLAVESMIRRPDPKRARLYAEGMLEDLSRLDRLVENVLTIGRFDAQALLGRPRPVDLAPLVRDHVQRWLTASGMDPGSLELRIPESAPAEADPSALAPLIGNLLDNARKYGEGRTIVLQLSRGGGRVDLTVSDSGRGFTAEESRHLFERFWRAGDERVRSTPGTGLGLHLVQRLAHAQGATVHAESPGPGHGASFSIRWPAAEEEA